jgi:hypothetical protein
MLRYKKTIEYIGSRSNVLGKLKNLKTLKPQVVKDLVIQALAGLEDEETMQFTFSDIVRESKSTYVTLSRATSYAMVPQEARTAVQAIGHEIAVEFALQLLKSLMDYISLDKNGKPKNLGSLKGTQLFIEYPFGGKQYEYRCHILKELAIGLVQGRPSITNIHKKFGAIDSVSSKDVETEVNGFVDLALNYAAEYKGWQLSQQSSRVQYISDIDYSGKQSKETSKKKRKHEDSRPTSASVLEEDDYMYWSKLSDDDLLVDTPQQLKSQQQALSSPMQSTGIKSRKVSQEDNDFRPSAASSAPLFLKATSEALEVINYPQQQPPQQQSAAQSQEATVSAIAAAAAAAPFPSAAGSVDSAVALSTEQNISSILFRGRSVQEWVDIATRSLSQPEPNAERLLLSPRSKKRKRKIALGVFEYTVDEDDLKAFLEEKAEREEVSY